MIADVGETTRRVIWVVQQPRGGPRQMCLHEDGCAIALLFGDGRENAGGQQESGGVVERLRRQRAGPCAVRRLDDGDSGRRLDDAVETPSLRPWSDTAPG